MTSVLKNMCTDKLDDIVSKYNNTCHRTIKMKPFDVKDNTSFKKYFNGNDLKFNP